MINVLRNWLDMDSANILAATAKRKGISLCGIKQTTTDFVHERPRAS